MFRLFAALACAAAAYLIAPGAAAQSPSAPAAARTDTPSGLPVPRFVSLKRERTHCRAGPSFAHPIAITYVRAGLPLLVVAETTDHWRKLRDVDGAECWAHHSTLRAVNHVIVRAEIVLHAEPDPEAPARAVLAEGVVARLDRTGESWALVSASGLRGWAPVTALWGVSQEM